MELSESRQRSGCCQLGLLEGFFGRERLKWQLEANVDPGFTMTN